MKQVSNFTMVDVSGLQANSNSFIIDVAGNCMNSDKSPMRAKDGDSLLVHPENMCTDTFLRYFHKLVCIRFAKHIFL
jgi:SOS-response transcriptional repressor LexA